MNHPNRRWREEDGYFALDALFYDDWAEILRMCQDEDDPEEWYVVSEKLGIEYDYITSETLEDAKEECEYKVTEYLEDQIAYYQDQLNQWEDITKEGASN